MFYSFLVFHQLPPLSFVYSHFSMFKSCNWSTRVDDKFFVFITRVVSSPKRLWDWAGKQTRWTEFFRRMFEGHRKSQPNALWSLEYFVLIRVVFALCWHRWPKVQIFCFFLWGHQLTPVTDFVFNALFGVRLRFDWCSLINCSKKERYGRHALYHNIFYFKLKEL